MADRRNVRVHARVSPAELAGRPGRPALPVRGRGIASAVVPVADATTVLPLLSSLRTKLSPAGHARAWCFRR